MAHAYRDLPGAGSKLSMMIGYAYVQIPGTSDLSWDGFKRGMRTPTPLSAVAAVKKPGMPDFGQIKAKVFYDPNDATHQTIVDSLTVAASVKSANLDLFKLEYPDNFATPAHLLITGFVSEFGNASGDAETGTWTADLTIEVTDVDIVAGAPAE